MPQLVKRLVAKADSMSVIKSTQVWRQRKATTRYPLISRYVPFPNTHTHTVKIKATETIASW